MVAIKTSPGFPVTFGRMIQAIAVKRAKQISASMFANRIGILIHVSNSFDVFFRGDNCAIAFVKTHWHSIFG